MENFEPKFHDRFCRVPKCSASTRSYTTHQLSSYYHCSFDKATELVVPFHLDSNCSDGTFPSLSWVRYFSYFCSSGDNQLNFLFHYWFYCQFSWRRLSDSGLRAQIYCGKRGLMQPRVDFQLQLNSDVIRIRFGWNDSTGCFPSNVIF